MKSAWRSLDLVLGLDPFCFSLASSLSSSFLFFESWDSLASRGRGSLTYSVRTHLGLALDFAGGWLCACVLGVARERGFRAGWLLVARVRQHWRGSCC